MEPFNHPAARHGVPSPCGREVPATPNGGTTVLAVSQDGLASGERIEEWRAHWKGLLSAL
ncbi:hypothetical protein [Leucobacter massiliensis]|uniref:hypothetical protein n=1 Tax=Leucobacter massiliensis TaxID=1686285 RepID=UPI0011B1D872|nr:hypothetical protein [Leucobacter massiliensis]